jgi:hypothetical protein
MRAREMKTFFEYFLDEILRKQAAGEIEEATAQRWITELKNQLREYARSVPGAPIAQMPILH